MKVSFPYELRAQPDRQLYAGNLYTHTLNAPLVIKMCVNPGRALPISFVQVTIILVASLKNDTRMELNNM